jgi:hypothetical protein
MSSASAEEVGIATTGSPLAAIKAVNSSADAGTGAVRGLPKSGGLAVTILVWPLRTTVTHAEASF